MKKTKEVWIIPTVIIASLIIGFVIGAFVLYSQDFQYKDAAVMTCKYANNLTNIINLQSKTLSLYTGNNYTTLDYLNCSLIFKDVAAP